ncbi:MAG: T9SS type A sorting domain-containing protein [Bacteroidales bacterium]|nr:T9SS type A sorting domain-containing protein [Bacteroidales bacterium]
MIVIPYFNDKNLVPDIELPTQEWATGYNLESRQLIDSAFMRHLMGDSAEQDFIFENGFYPRLRNMDERPGRLAASPILLYPGENADSVILPFYVDTNYGVRWRSMNEDIIKIEGNIGYVRHPVLKETTVRVEAWKEDFSKHVYLTVPASNFVYQDLLSDTVCPGDSVKMINSYARNEGWNYEVVETASAEYDTIYRMYLHHYPTYREVVHRAAVERDSLPYIFGKDTIRNFGLTELHRYQTVHGCDSVIYVQLDTLYIHREQHFYDTLHTCEGGALSWRGREITQTGDYADTVFDPYKGGTDSIYHLRADIYPVYHDTFTDSCYIEELPYAVAGRPIASYGTHTVNLVSEPGCDSVCKYVLTRRWHWYNVRVKVRGEGSVNATDTVLREDASLWLSFSASSCYKLNSLTVNGKAVPLQGRYELKDLHGDCTVEVGFASLASAETRVEKRVCVDSLPMVYNGVVYGAGEHEILFRNAAGCDSVVRLQVQEKENTARIAVVDTIAPPCGASEISFSYRTETGSPKHLRLVFDPVALSAGFRDTTMEVSSTGLQTVRIALPPSVHSDRYGLQLLQADGTGCYVAEDALTFEIPYPSNIIVQKWNDVLAVLSAEYNGGYEFSGYQWYRNGEPLEGETRPYYYAKPYLRSGDTYAVLLERASDGLKLPSCGVKRKGYPKGFSLELLPNPVAAGEAVQVSVDGKPNVEGTIEVFDGTGKPVYQRTFRRSHTLRLSVQPGSYVVRVRDAKATWTATGKLLVQ